MKHIPLIAIFVVATLGAGVAEATPPYMKPDCRSQYYNWHANYAYTAYGAPVALVVPPTANLQTNWSWGAPSMSVSRVDHQFGRSYPGPGPFGSGYNYTPHWPSHTAQFGVYHVRAPWYPTQP